MLQLLRKIETISACRDRDILGASVAAAIHEAFGARRVELLRCAGGSGNATVALAVRASAGGLMMVEDGEEKAGAEEAPQLIESCPLVFQAWQEKRAVSRTADDGVTLVHPMALSAGAAPFGFLVVEMARAPDAVELEAMARFLHFYCNYVGLLDYSELDTLTGLFNRKTFDEAFDRILAQASKALGTQTGPGGAERRQDEHEDKPHWLAVVDIDHFKRVNDNFGHLFGDEVLLRLANIMRKTFRSYDKLFRFGGEEFIVMLRSATRENAIAAFDRLRRNVAVHEFPQVGQVTCSVGFSRVDPLLSPPDILGQADAALYYSKENGRNLVSCYEELVETGRLVPQQVRSAQPDIDIDALFD